MRSRQRSNRVRAGDTGYYSMILLLVAIGAAAAGLTVVGDMFLGEPVGEFSGGERTFSPGSGSEGGNECDGFEFNAYMKNEGEYYEVQIFEKGGTLTPQFEQMMDEGFESQGLDSTRPLLAYSPDIDADTGEIVAHGGIQDLCLKCGQWYCDTKYGDKWIGVWRECRDRVARGCGLY